MRLYTLLFNILALLLISACSNKYIQKTEKEVPKEEKNVVKHDDHKVNPKDHKVGAIKASPKEDKAPQQPQK